MTTSSFGLGRLLRRSLSGAAFIALTACGSQSDQAPQDSNDIFLSKLSAQCQTPLAVSLSKISIHANDPLLEANLELANRCGKEMAQAVRANTPVTKADRIISPLNGLINFESPHVHPIDLTPDGNTLVGVNTAAHKLEVWRLTGNQLTAIASIPVGMDPVTVRARSNNEVWVVNHISDSISIVDLSRQTVIRTLSTDNEPADVVFAGSNKAFVTASEANSINVFDLNDLNVPAQVVSIDGEDPRSLAVSADGQTVYAAIFESGNGTRQNGTAFGAGGSIVRDNLNPDNDVAIIDTGTLTVEYRRRLMNMVMAVGVHPVSQQVYAVGTEALNDIAGEPALNGKFIKVQVANFTGPGLGNATISDLNPHLDYSSPTVAPTLRQLSLGDPRAITWRNDGQQAFVTGMGSNNIAVINTDNGRVSQFSVGQGPTGIVLNDSANLGFVMNKFAGSISIIDLNGLTEISQIAFDDPTPAAIKAGRPFIYDTHLTSGTGHLSCASCHVDSRTDRLGWQLSDGEDRQLTIDRASNSLPGNVIGTSTISSNKQVMVTQTLLDIMEHPNFHWRGDKPSIDSFNPTYVNLMGRDSEIGSAEMAAMKDYLRTLWLPPNPYRNIDNTRPTTVVLPDGSTATSNRVQVGRTNALRGGGNSNNCLMCHSGQTLATRNFGANPEVGSNVVAPTLPALYDKIGFTFGRSGFGFFHHGGADLFEASRTREFLAEILTLEGPEGPLANGEIRQAPHAGVGQQITIGSNPSADDLARLDRLITIANTSAWAELVAHGNINDVQRGFVLRSGQTFAADATGETASRAELLTQASNGRPITFTIVATGMSTRLALDSNLDGILNNEIIDSDSDGTPDNQDAFPFDPTEQLDTDGDGTGNNADDDDDNDGVPDVDDLDPLDPAIGGNDLVCNLFSDPGFESGLGNWASNADPTPTSTAHSGSRALVLNNGYLGQVLPASPGTRYDFSGFYQSAGSEWAGFGVDFVDASGNEIGEVVRSLDTADSYAAFSLQVQVPFDAGFIRPWFYSQSGRTLILDDLNLRKSGCRAGNAGNQAPFIANPGDQTHQIGASINLSLNGTDPEGESITYSASHLPEGLTIDSSTGVISGIATGAVSTTVVISASDGQNTTQISFAWQVTDDLAGTSCNQLANGGFDSGLAGWISSVNPQLVSIAGNGNQAVQFEAGWISTTLPASAGAGFVLSGNYLSSGNSGWAGFGIDFLDSSNLEIGEQVATLGPRQDTGALSLTASAPTGTSAIRLWFYADAGRTLTIDAIDLRTPGCE